MIPYHILTHILRYNTTDTFCIVQYSAPEDMTGRLNQLVLHDKHQYSNRNERPNYHGHGHGYATNNHVPAILHNLSGQGGRALYSSQHHIMVPATRIGGQPTVWKSQAPHNMGSNAQIMYDKGNVSIFVYVAGNLAYQYWRIIGAYQYISLAHLMFYYIRKWLSS